ncbi:aldehyde dehydrogenase family 16 member A1 isoform X3 [Eretmochelys imbricata]
MVLRRPEVELGPSSGQGRAAWGQSPAGINGWSCGGAPVRVGHLQLHGVWACPRGGGACPGLAGDSRSKLWAFCGRQMVEAGRQRNRQRHQSSHRGAAGHHPPGGAGGRRGCCPSCHESLRSLEPPAVPRPSPAPAQGWSLLWLPGIPHCCHWPGKSAQLWQWMGRSLRRATAGGGPRLSLQLGGDTLAVVFDSADLDGAAVGLSDAVSCQRGLAPGPGALLLVQEAVAGALLQRLKMRLGQLRVGDPLDKAMDGGALADEAQRGAIETYVEEARAEGAEIFQAWAALPARGPFYPPTLITGVASTSRCVREEILGPVLVVLPFRTAKEAVALGNHRPSGLAASVWTENLPLAMEVAQSLQVGTVWINGQNFFDAAAGVGGTKESGNGRDGGKEGLYEYVRPSWQSRPRPGPTELDYKTFAASYGADPPSVPGHSGVACPELEENMPRVDRTYKLYYGGAQKRPEGMASLPVLDPAGNVLAYVADGSAKDIRNAVEAAHKAAPGWGKRAAHTRAQVLYYVAENLELRREEVASRLGALTGAPPEEARREVDLGLERLFHWAACCDKSGGVVQETPLHGTTLRLCQPLGVVGVACPDEHPLLSFLSLLAPAVARGNAVVMVPSPRYPLPALDLCQIFDTSDVPGGVVNIVTGNRDHLSRTLVQHQDVQAMWYFGSPQGSQFVEWASAGNLKRTWVSHGAPRRWEDPAQGAGEEFLYQATQCKNIWIPMGEIFAN